MDPDRLEQRLSWLDEQRRKDLGQMSSFEERLTKLEESIAGQRKEIEAATGDLARLSTLAARISEFDDALHVHRQEVTRQLKDTEERRDERLKNQDQLWHSDLDALATKVTELRKDVEDLAGLQEALDVRKEEELKLHRGQDELEKRLRDLEDRAEDQVHSLSNLVENTRSDAKRINEVQGDLSGLRARVESIKGSIDLIEDRARRQETQLGELSATEKERREVLDSWTENQNRKLVDFERQWKNWEERFGAFEAQGEELEARMVQYEETFRQTKQLQSSLEKVIERLERRINEVTEMQRLSQDRFQQEWTSFQADDQKRWSTHKLTQDEHWREHARIHDRLQEQVEALRQDVDQSKQEFEAVVSAIDRRVRSLLVLASDWVENLES
jgi:chromosome segregation ATPase